MIKKCTGYKMYCDVCGKQIGGVFSGKDAAYIYATCGGCKVPGTSFVYCSKQCLENFGKKVEKG